MNFIDHYREAQAKDEEIARLKAEITWLSASVDNLRHGEAVSGETVEKLRSELNRANALLARFGISETAPMSKQPVVDVRELVAGLSADYLSRALSSRDIPDAYGRA